jgi:proline dehydrogenase
MSAFNRVLVTGLPAVPKPIVGKVASRYVAGETLDAAVGVIRDLNAKGAMATLDVLGEEVHEKAKALASVDEYLRALERIDREKIDSNVSIKPTMLGLKIDEGFCHENIGRIVEKAKSFGNFVRIDMEDTTTTEATLRIYRDLQARFGNVGCVLQAYMRRTLKDIDELPAQGANVRLCKGIYVEPRTIAWKGFDTIRANYVQALEKLIVRGVYVGIATHDEYLACAASALIDKHGLKPDRYELQRLLGVDEELRRILLDAGHRLRVYVPYGPDWYAYSLRRLRENPEVARHVLKAMLSGK